MRSYPTLLIVALLVLLIGLSREAQAQADYALHVEARTPDDYAGFFEGRTAVTKEGCCQFWIINPYPSDNTGLGQPAEIVFDRTTGVGPNQFAAVGIGGSQRDFFIYVNGQDRLNITDNGNVGIGTSTPSGKLDIHDAFKFQTHNLGPYNQSMRLFLEEAPGTPNLWGFSLIYTGDNDGEHIFDGTTFNLTSNKLFLLNHNGNAQGHVAVSINRSNGRVGIGTGSPDGTLDVNGDIVTDEIEIRDGSDLSENFDVTGGGAAEPLPGMVVSVDATRPGALVVSNTPNDRKVAGVVSGAGGIKTGLLMGQRGSEADGAFPVALSGRVYVYVDAGYSAVEPGDLLTTSATPGHAMAVTDYEAAQGAILGKAMTGLEAGRGLVLVLVSLQ